MPLAILGPVDDLLPVGRELGLPVAVPFGLSLLRERSRAAQASMGTTPEEAADLALEVMPDDIKALLPEEVTI